MIIRTLISTSLLVGGSLLLVGEAQAQSDGEWQEDPVPGYVVVASMDEEVAEVAARVGAAARAALRAVDRVDSRAADQAYLGYDSAAADHIETAQRLFEEGRQAYLDLELETAISQLSASIEAFDRGAAALEDVSNLGEALLYLGASQVFARQLPGARDTFTRLHVQLPQVVPDPDIFNPDVVERYEAARPRDASNPRSSIMVESEPPGAIVYINGTVRGRTPLQVDDLVGGRHAVRIMQPGAIPYVEQVDVRRGRSANVSAFLLEAEGMEELSNSLTILPTDSDMRPERDGPTVMIGQMLGVERLGVIRVSPGDTEEQALVELLVFNTDDRRRLLRMHGPISVEAGRLESLVGQLVTQGFEAAIRPQQQADAEDIIAQNLVEPIEEAEEDSSEGGILTKWWFWTAIGGAVAVGVTVGVLASGGGPELGQDPTGTVVFDF